METEHHKEARLLEGEGGQSAGSERGGRVFAPASHLSKTFSSPPICRDSQKFSESIAHANLSARCPRRSWLSQMNSAIEDLEDVCGNIKEMTSSVKKDQVAQQRAEKAK